MTTNRRTRPSGETQPRAAKIAPRTAHGRALAARAVASRRRIVFGVLAVIFIALAAWGVYRAVAAYLSSTPSAQVDQAMEYVARADVSIVQLDDVLNSRVTTATLSEVTQARAGVQVAVDALESADTILTRVRRTNPGLDSVPMLQQAIDARLDMLALAPSLISVTEASAKALTAATSGYGILATAASSAADAKKQFNPKSDNQLKKTLASCDRAIARYGKAQEKFVAAQDALPEAEFGGYLNYINVRIEMTRALRSAAADLIANKPEAANAKITAYNQLTARATSIAKGLGDVTEIVVAGYKAAAGTLSQDYSAARDKVLGLDQLVR